MLTIVISDPLSVRSLRGWKRVKLRATGFQASTKYSSENWLWVHEGSLANRLGTEIFG